MKLFIQGFAIVALLFAGSVTAEAQLNYRADVSIPFEFNIGEKAHQPGRYTVMINRQMVVGAALVIHKVGSDDVQTILLTDSGGERSGDVQLVFSSVDGRKYLTGVTTANNDFALVTRKAFENRLAKSKTKGKGKNTEL